MLKIVLVIGIFSAISIILLKKYMPEYAFTLSLSASALILIIAITEISKFIDELRSVCSKFEINEGYLAIVLKAMGICYLTEFAVNICKDFNQNSIAEKIQLTGKITMLVLSLPMIEQIITTALELLG